MEDWEGGWVGEEDVRVGSVGWGYLRGYALGGEHYVCVGGGGVVGSWGGGGGGGVGTLVGGWVRVGVHGGLCGGYVGGGSWMIE